MGDVLDGYIDKISLVWVDDIVNSGETPEILLKWPLAVLDCMLVCGRFRCRPQGHSRPKGNQAVLENPLRAHGKPRPRAQPETKTVASTVYRPRAHAFSSSHQLDVDVSAGARGVGGAAVGAARKVSVQHTSHRPRGGAPCYWQQREDVKPHCRVACCATISERRGASKPIRARLLCDVS